MAAETKQNPLPESVRLSDDERSVVILDQTQLPGKVEFLVLRSLDQMYDAIHTLKVRGAPAIGIFAAYAIYALSRQIDTDAFTYYETVFQQWRSRLQSARPTAVDLQWALDRMAAIVAKGVDDNDMGDVLDNLGKECRAIHRENIAMCKAISEFGLSLLHDGDGILTHCNAGPLATSQYGTGLGPILLGKEKGMEFHVYADETRPLLQGARLTACELSRAGVDVTLICDNMASIVMKNGWIQACLVGCDRVAANGDTANKIGTSGVAILAKHYGIPFYVLGPTSTIDMSCPTGDDIVIEQRDPNEIRSLFYEKPQAPENVPCYNPAFDVTDHELITAIITEKGIVRPPYVNGLKNLFDEN